MGHSDWSAGGGQGWDNLDIKMSNFPPPTSLPPPSDSSDHETSSDISSMEDVDLIQWDLEVSGQPGGRQFQLPTLPAHGPRPVGHQGQAARPGALGPGCQPGLPIISPPHQNQQTSAPPVAEPGNQLAALTAAMEQFQQQQKVLVELVQQLLLDRQQARPGELGTFPASPQLPAPPHQARAGQHFPPAGRPDRVGLSGPSSGDRPQLAAASSRPPAAHHREAAPTAGGEATAPWPAGDLLGVLRQMQEKQIRYQQRQQHQQEVLAALMKQLVAPGTSPGPQPRPRETVSPPPLAATQPGRPPLQVGDPGKQRRCHQNKSRQRDCYLIPSSWLSTYKQRKLKILMTTMKRLTMTEKNIPTIRTMEPIRKAARTGRGMPGTLMTPSWSSSSSSRRRTSSRRRSW